MKPELLAPAGSPAALRAAVDAGADAVYFGVQDFNARRHAENFTEESVVDAIRYCHLYGVKTHIVLNIQLYRNELEPAASLAGTLLAAGADAFIVADLGLAVLLGRRFPDIALHASTQASGQNVLSAEVLAEIGFCRMVAPRELPLRDIRTLCRNSPIETEIFVHGALCVSHSGQCLFSSVIGGRSGNRGECAQPCRLPYRARHPYALSLKDLCLAAHIPEILETGVASLKIEGRMKSADYVYGVVSVYRRLLDEERPASEREWETLAGLFSRTGFTDGYFTERISSDMIGVRTEADKKRSAAHEGGNYGKKRLPLAIEGFFLAEKPAVLRGTVTRGAQAFSAEVTGPVCEKAESAPLSRPRIQENLTKLGGTVFAASSVCVEENGIRIPISEINGLRRALCAALEEKLIGKHSFSERSPVLEAIPSGFIKSEEKSAFFAFFDAVTPRSLVFFDRIFLPLSEYLLYAEEVSRYPKIGIALPPVAFDHELPEVRSMTERAVSAGCSMAMVSGLWQCRLAREFGLVAHGSLRLNLFHAGSVEVYRGIGLCSAVLSPEIGVSASAGMRSGIPKGYVLYGRLPLMTLEKCIIRDNLPAHQDGKCRYCDTHRVSYLTDRTGARFPVLRVFRHRNVLYNSVPVYMADKPIPGLFGHCIFTDETRDEVDAVIERMEKRAAPSGKFKRL